MSDETHFGFDQKDLYNTMFASVELTTKLKEYLEGQITLWDLESWLVPRLAYFVHNLDSSEAKLAGTIELCLSELRAGIRSERSVRTLLSRHFADMPAILSVYPPRISDNETSSSTPLPRIMIFDWPAQSPS